MNQNPYQFDAGGAPQPNRTMFVLAGVGALLASLYWLALTLLLGLGVSTGSVSPVQIIIPFVLIALYALRAVQLFKCDARAAQRILWLHGVGAVVAFTQIARTPSTLFIILQGIKVAIHIFGAITAYLATRRQ